jgi:hypothetical protein
MVTPDSLRFLNQRIAVLIQRYDSEKSRHRSAILQELSELAVIRDELKKIQQHAVNRPKQLPQRLPKEFPTLGALVHRLNSTAQQIAQIRKDDPRRTELLNEITRLCLVADSVYKREL